MKSFAELPQSRPLLLLFSEEGHHPRAHWEIWSRHAPSGAPPRWVSLPSSLHEVVEASWIEGQPSVRFTLPVRGGSTPWDESGDPSAEEQDLAPGQYMISFGDDRQVQHTVKRLGAGGWQAKARRTVFALECEEEAKQDDSQGDDKCVICMEEKRTHAFMHSDTGDGHLAVCNTCADTFRAERAAGSASQAFRTCPMCRRPFTSLQRIFR